MADTAYEAITITNEIHTGAAFGIQHGTGRSCYIPATVMYSSGSRPGDVVQAVLIDNPSNDPDIRNRTPYLVRFIKPMVTPTQLELPLEQPSQLAQEIVAKLGGAAPTPAPAPAPVPTIKERAAKHVEATMMAGGVWRFATMFEDFMAAEGKPGAARSDHMEEYWAVAHVMRRLFETDRCAKWVLYNRASNTKASREWYSCRPETIDVAEFDDE